MKKNLKIGVILIFAFALAFNFVYLRNIEDRLGVMEIPFHQTENPGSELRKALETCLSENGINFSYSSRDKYNLMINEKDRNKAIYACS